MNAETQFAKATGNEAALLRYWHERMGAGQGRPGDYDECVAALSKHAKIGDPHALCQWLHIQATGKPAGHAAAEVKHAMKLSTERDGITLFANWDSQAKRDAAPAETFCGPHKSFPVSDCEDVTHARMLEHHNPSVGACVERKAKSLGCPEKTENAMEIHDDGTRFSFDAELTPAGVTTPEGMVVRRGKIFEVGDYPDKGFALSPEEAVIEVERFQPVPLSAGHPNAPSQLDGKMGKLQAISYSDDGVLSGEVHIAPWLNELLGSDPLTVSTEWSKGKRISALSLVTNPRVSDAALMAAFSADFARNDVAGNQKRWQKIHDQCLQGRCGLRCCADGSGEAQRYSAGAQHRRSAGAVLLRRRPDVRRRKQGACLGTAGSGKGNSRKRARRQLRQRSEKHGLQEVLEASRGAGRRAG